MRLHLIKAHGSGNDFFILDELEGTPLADEARRQLAIALCDRSKAFGADGLLFIEPATGADGRMRIFNADGSEAEMCGNGIRLVGRYVAEKLGRKAVTIENVTGLRYGLAEARGFFEAVTAYELEMPPATFETGDIIATVGGAGLDNAPIPGFVSDRPFTGVRMPNPHLVAVVEEVHEAELAAVGHWANSEKAVFPQGINVNFVRKIDEQTVFVGTYERGVGLTNACGTGMFASVLVAARQGLVPQEQWIKVVNRGGFVLCLIHADHSGRMRGNATYEYETTVELGPDFEVIGQEVGRSYVEEVEGYAGLVSQAKKTIM